jgi:hypothetical protein
MDPKNLSWTATEDNIAACVLSRGFCSIEQQRFDVGGENSDFRLLSNNFLSPDGAKQLQCYPCFQNPQFDVCIGPSLHNTAKGKVGGLLYGF